MLGNVHAESARPRSNLLTALVVNKINLACTRATQARAEKEKRNHHKEHVRIITYWEVLALTHARVLASCSKFFGGGTVAAGEKFNNSLMRHTKVAVTVIDFPKRKELFIMSNDQTTH